MTTVIPDQPAVDLANTTKPQATDHGTPHIFTPDSLESVPAECNG